MSKLSDLQKKRSVRVTKRKRHYARYLRFRATKKRVRRNFQFKRFKQQIKAIEKLDWLIDKEEARLKGARINWNGCAPVGGPNLRAVLRYGLNENSGCYVTSTNGGVHTPTSYHYRNEAVDIGASTTDQKIKFQHDIYDRFGAGMFAELFGPDNSPWVKNGSTYSEGEGTPLETLHDTHVHFAVIG